MPTIRRYYTLPKEYVCGHDRSFHYVELGTVTSPRRTFKGEKFLAQETHPGAAGGRYLVTRPEAARALWQAHQDGAIIHRVSFPIPD